MYSYSKKVTIVRQREDESLVSEITPLTRTTCDASSNGDAAGEYDVTPKEESLLGRTKQKGRLVESLERIARPSSPSEIALVSGVSGVGKSALITASLRERTVQEGGFFVTGKFDASLLSYPFAALVSALSDIGDLIEQTTDIKEAVSASIRKTLSVEDVTVLSSVVPNLPLISGYEDILKDDSGDTVVASGPAKPASPKRLASLLRTYLAAVACQGIPLVLFMDDLQWADDQSLEIIEALATDHRSQNSLMVLSCWRSDEVRACSRLSSLIDSLRSKHVGRASESSVVVDFWFDGHL